MTAAAPLLDHALRALAAGLNVAPVREDGTKRPDLEEWTSRKTCMASEDEIRGWFANGRTGMGVICGAVSGNLEMFEFEGRAIDEGVGQAFLNAADAAGLRDVIDRIASGYSERTPSGGMHWLYRCEEVGGNTKLARRPATDEELATNPDERIKVLLETRGEGGYTVTAPSHGRVHDSGKAWEIVQGGFDSIATITPEERRALFDVARAFDQMPRAEARPPATAPRPADGDRPGDEFNARATWAEVLEPHGWAFVFQRGDTAHWRRPGKAIGISATTNHADSDLLYVFSSSTPFEPERGYSKFSAYALLNHGSDFEAAGRALVEAGYGAAAHDRRENEAFVAEVAADPFVTRIEQRAARAEAERTAPSIEDRLTAATLTSDQLKDMPKVPQLVDGVLARDSIAVLYGPSGGGKTFTTVDLTLSIVTASWWHGRRVEAGPVVYVVAEGAARLGQRVASWQEHHKLYELGRYHPVHWLPLAVNLHEAAWASALALYCEQRRPVLVVIDTLARCTVGADENSAKDMGEVIYQVDAIRRRTGACVLLVHHSGKDVAAGARGSSALRAAVDTELEVIGSEGAVTLRVRKQKDGAEVPPIPLRLRPVGDSCVLVQPSLLDDDGGPEVPPSALATLEALREIQVAGGIPSSAWQKASPFEERAFYNHRRRLLDAGLIRNVGTERTPRYLTADFDTATHPQEAAG